MMRNQTANLPHGKRRAPRWIAWVALCTLVPGGLGCAALKPIKGVPARYFPRDLHCETRSNKETIDLSRLRQTPPPEYLLDSGDVLGIYIEGVLGKRDEVPPVYFPVAGDIPPTLGFPIPIREDGTVSLPLIPPVVVRGLTVRRAEEAIRRAYLQDQEILKPGNDRILVSLQKPRTYQVLVIRQEAATNLPTLAAGFGTVNLGALKRGSGQLVTLTAYKNDVLHALAQTGGLPGLDAENAVYVLRPQRAALVPPPLPPQFPPSVSQTASPAFVQQVAGFFPSPNPAGHTPAAESSPAIDLAGGGGHTRAEPTAQSYGGNAPGLTFPNSPEPPAPQLIPGPPPVEQLPAGARQLPWNGPPPATAEPFPPSFNPMPDSNVSALLQTYGPQTHIVKIPIRLSPGESALFSEQDVILREGDIVFIESRETEIFYTGGLLGGGQFTLPRDYDLDVLGAIAIASGRQQGGGSGQGIGNRVGGISAMNQDISVSASDVVILRQLPDGNQIPIKVDLTRALRDPRERILIQPGDYVILQYKPIEAVGAFIERNLLAGSLIGLATTQAKGGN